MLKRVVIKEELVELTGDFRPAIILNQFIYWTERMKDTDRYIEEEIERASKEDIKIDMDKSYGWIYKTTDELNEEVMLGMSAATIRKYIKQLIDAGYLKERKNPKYKWDKTMQYRVDIYKVQLELAKLGYALEGYKLLPNIQIVQEDSKKAPTEPPVEARRTCNTDTSKKQNNSITNISQSDKTYNKNSYRNNCKNKGVKLNPKIHKGLSTKFLEYGTEEELEISLKEVQGNKFNDSYRELYNICLNDVSGNKWSELSYISKVKVLDYAKENELLIPSKWEIDRE